MYLFDCKVLGQLENSFMNQLHKFKKKVETFMSRVGRPAYLPNLAFILSTISHEQLVLIYQSKMYINPIFLYFRIPK